MATRADEKPSDLVTIFPKHRMKPILIPAQGAHSYLIKELLLMNLLSHTHAILWSVIKTFCLCQKIFSKQGIPGEELMQYASDQTTT